MKKTKEKMQDVADYLNKEFPGLGFALIVFPKNAAEDTNYVSNCDRIQMIKALDEVLYRWKKGN